MRDRMNKRINHLAGLLAVAFSSLPVIALGVAVNVTGLPVIGV